MRQRRAFVLTVVALLAAAGRAGSQENGARTASPPATVADPSARFHFIERYAVEPDRTKPEVLSQYQVAILETIKTTIEQPQGAPQRAESSLRTIYTERPARVGTGSKGDVLDVVRRYEACRPVPDRTRPDDARPLEGLTLWYHPRIGARPSVVSMTERTLRDGDYIRATRQVFLPELRGILPARPMRVGDTWPILAVPAQTLLCDPSAHGRDLVAKLIDVREVQANGASRRWSARIAISGRAPSALNGDAVINAELDFQFAPPAPAGTAAKKAAGDESVIEAQGAITTLRMALSATGTISPDPKQRLRQIITHELVLQRRPSPENSPPLPVPAQPPAPTEANSWLTVVPPEVPAFPRFTFRHPQELLPPPDAPPLPNEVVLVDRVPETRDKITFEMIPKMGTTEDRKARDPEDYRRRMLAAWEKQRLEVVQGPHGWLPAGEWEALNMKVYRIQAALKETRREFRHEPRTYLDFYLILFGRDECLVVEASTSQDPPIAFRAQTEAMLKSFRFDGSKTVR